MRGDRPEDDDGRPPPGRSAHAEQRVTTPKPATIKSQQTKPNAGGRYRRRAPLGLHAMGFYEGFDAGAASALRLMGRRCHCVDCAAEVEALADYYAGAAERRGA